MGRYQKIAQIKTANKDFIAYIEKNYIVVSETEEEGCDTFHIVVDTEPPEPEPEPRRGLFWHRS